MQPNRLPVGIEWWTTGLSLIGHDELKEHTCVDVQSRFVSYLTSLRVFVRVDENEMLLATENAMEMIVSITE